MPRKLCWGFVVPGPDGPLKIQAERVEAGGSAATAANALGTLEHRMDAPSRALASGRMLCKRT
eukprot:CAMPEP_0203960810 /NCGR_PEP_ID=MMETSP0359-20131031/91400_1 /ASSEMBLY_ACC=CAM_ASM_000338 /TAXON_ID=268821 /ORGANISM="Scrippsiella Hangoei, Strain SHTV-5" /LENGTH=62 /DNA_ID=CAMNT_0050895305 /DNA_START=134 /DNA_END=318 /DNA_ORIENTATION=+